MHLVLQVSTLPPAKSSWHVPNQIERGEWSRIFEIISTWFCSSHTFNKEDNLVIQYKSACIVMVGEHLRYLAPSLRSAASLVHKAFTLLSDNQIEVIESTSGIWVYPDSSSYHLPLPHIKLTPHTISSPTAPSEGSLFCFEDVTSKEYYAPARQLSQAVVWYLQRR